MEHQEEAALAVEHLINYAYTVIEARYGEKGLKPLDYHNQHHTRAVVSAARNIAGLAIQNGTFDEERVTELQVAAGFHDIVQLLGSGVNETRSIQEMEQSVALLGRSRPTLSDERVERAGLYIAATVVNVDGGVMRQSATDKDYGERIIADADLSSLGAQADVFWPQVQGLFRELHGVDADTDTQIRFLELSQVPLLNHHRFYTPEAEVCFPNQEANLRFTVSVLNLLKSENSQYGNLLYASLNRTPEIFGVEG